MNINELLRRYEILYVSFDEKEEEDFKKRLISLGFDVPKKLKSPAKIHRDRTVSFISGFNEGMLYSFKSEFKRLRPECFQIEYSKISDEHAYSAWYKHRAQN